MRSRTQARRRLAGAPSPCVCSRRVPRRRPRPLPAARPPPARPARPPRPDAVSPRASRAAAPGQPRHMRAARAFDVLLAGLGPEGRGQRRDRPARLRPGRRAAPRGHAAGRLAGRASTPTPPITWIGQVWPEPLGRSAGGHRRRIGAVHRPIHEEACDRRHDRPARLEAPRAALAAWAPADGRRGARTAAGSSRIRPPNPNRPRRRSDRTSAMMRTAATTISRPPAPSATGAPGGLPRPRGRAGRTGVDAAVRCRARAASACPCRARCTWTAAPWAISRPAATSPTSWPSRPTCASPGPRIPTETIAASAARTVPIMGARSAPPPGPRRPSPPRSSAGPAPRLNDALGRLPRRPGTEPVPALDRCDRAVRPGRGGQAQRLGRARPGRPRC